MTVKARLAAAVGKYTAGDGSEKTRRVNIGHLHSGQYGDYATLDPLALLGVCHAAIGRGEDRIMVAMYEADAGSPRTVAGPKPARSAEPAPQEDVPF